MGDNIRKNKVKQFREAIPLSISELARKAGLAQQTIEGSGTSPLQMGYTSIFEYGQIETEKHAENGMNAKRSGSYGGSRSFGLPATGLLGCQIKKCERLLTLPAHTNSHKKKELVTLG